MATKKLSKKLECVTVQLQANRSAVAFAENVKDNTAARNVVNIVLANAKDAAAFEPGKMYTIEISEDS